MRCPYKRSFRALWDSLRFLDNVAILLCTMASKHINYHEHIIVNPEIMGGRPVIKGTRIPVEVVLERLAHDLDTKTLIEDYPRLTEDGIKACLSYAQDVLGEIYPAPETKHPEQYANL